MREAGPDPYEYQCAFCGYDGVIDTVPVGLEAAHVPWRAFDGPDDVDNGLSLCSLHHKLFDKGAFGIGDGNRILVSQHFVGRSPTARDHVTALAGRPLIGPQPAPGPSWPLIVPCTLARSSEARHASTPSGCSSEEA
jgi:putative restriction endonuclease